METSAHASPSISSLYVYPVKGCKGQAIDSIDINDTGFAMDRQWMIVSSPKMKNVYQLPLTRMALIRPKLPEACWTGDWRQLPPSEACLTLSAPDTYTIKIPLAPDASKKLVKCSLWEWQGMTQDEGDEAAEWLSNFLGQSLRLVRYVGDDSRDPSSQRRVKAKYTPQGSQILTTFSYGFQFLLTNRGSAHDLHGRMGEELPDDRWRPNIVVEGAEAWGEDLWERFTISSPSHGTAIEMASVRPCDRCKVTATNQESLEQGEEPLKTLKRFRQGKHLGLTSAAVYFGWYVLALGKGRMSVGDSLEVTQYRSKFSDYGKEGPKVSKGSAKFVGSPEWIASVLVVALAAAFYAYAMHCHFWGL